MALRFDFSENVLNSVVGGKSTLDLPRLHIQTPDEAKAFLLGYGFDITQEQDLKKLWYFHRRALVFLEEKLGFELAQIPEVLRDARQLGDMRQLLMMASSGKSSESELQRWACALLRVMHVFVHSENDLFSSFTEEIQKQILAPFEQSIVHEGSTAQSLLRGKNPLSEPLSLLGFQVKPFKTSTSTVMKLLAKPDALAMSVYDKLGVRFITPSMFDAFRVVRFLVEENLISFPHIMPDQSSNNIYPVELFMQVAEELKHSAKPLSNSEVDAIYRTKLLGQKDRVEYLRKENFFSGTDYRFIKFIARKLIKIELPGGKGNFSFFFPFEVQIMDRESHELIQSGPAEHKAYKDRQRTAARQRVYPQDINSQ